MPSGSSTPVDPLAGYVPLYPFATVAQAKLWEKAYPTGGHQPWHLSATETALAFAQGYLGFRDIDRVLGKQDDQTGAHVRVGYLNPAGRAQTAAVLHVMRYGTGPLSPWEVVGSDDTSLTLDIPAYGATVRSPLPVGGRITGVDENIVVSVRQLDREQPLGRTAGQPAGGQAQPWSTTVSFAGARRGALLVVASTGGHVRQVERFAITGAWIA